MMKNRTLSMLPALTAIALAMAARGAFAAVGVRLNLVEPIVVTNIPAAYDAGYNAPTNGCWSFDQIVDIASNTGGLECYFINSFIDEPLIMAGNNTKGTVITIKGDGRTLAHEFGHAFGMRDIYITNDGDKDCGSQIFRIAEYISKYAAESDWNGGCDGQERPASRYYEPGTTLAMIIRRLVMFGTTSADDARDITAGNVRGVYYDRVGSSKVWDMGHVSVGFFNRAISTSHQ